jgi:hypothetical protein
VRDTDEKSWPIVRKYSSWHMRLLVFCTLRFIGCARKLAVSAPNLLVFAALSGLLVSLIPGALVRPNLHHAYASLLGGCSMRSGASIRSLVGL